MTNWVSFTPIGVKGGKEKEERRKLSIARFFFLQQKIQTQRCRKKPWGGKRNQPLLYTQAFNHLSLEKWRNKIFEATASEREPIWSRLKLSGSTEEALGCRTFFFSFYQLQKVRVLFSVCVCVWCAEELLRRRRRKKRERKKKLSKLLHWIPSLPALMMFNFQSSFLMQFGSTERWMPLLLVVCAVYLKKKLLVCTRRIKSPSRRQNKVPFALILKGFPWHEMRARTSLKYACIHIDTSRGVFDNRLRGRGGGGGQYITVQYMHTSFFCTCFTTPKKKNILWLHNTRTLLTCAWRQKRQQHDSCLLHSVRSSSRYD